SREAFKFAKAIGLDRDASARHGFDVTHTVVSRQLRIVVGADRLEGAIAVNRDAGLLKAAIGEDRLWSNCTDSLVPQLRQQRGQPVRPQLHLAIEKHQVATPGQCGATIPGVPTTAPPVPRRAYHTSNPGDGLADLRSAIVSQDNFVGYRARCFPDR